MRNALLVGGGAGVVALSGILAQHDPNFLALIWPLIAMAGGGAYVARHPEVLPAQARRLLPSGSRPGSRQLPQPGPAETTPAALASVPARSVSQTPPIGPDVSALNTLLLSELLVPKTSAPQPVPPCSLPELPELTYLPGLDSWWLSQYFPDCDQSQFKPIANRSLISLAGGVLALLAADGLSIRRATLGTSEGEAQQTDIWSIGLIIADREPSQAARERLCLRIARVHAQPYTSGGTAILVVLAQPVPSSQPKRAETRVSAQPVPARAIPAVSPALPGRDDDLLELPVSPPPLVRDADDLAGLMTNGLPVAAQTPRAAGQARDALPTDLLALERAAVAAATRAPALLDRAPFEAPAPEVLADFALRAPIWRLGDPLPLVHVGVKADGSIVTSPLEHINIIAPTRGGKTSVKLHFIRQLLRVRHPVSGEPVLTLFISTKYTPINQFRVDIRPIISRCYNLRMLEAPQGIEEDGSGAYRVLMLTGAELDRRLKLTREQPGSRFTPFALFADEWRVIRTRTEKLVLPEDAEGRRPDAWEQCLNVIDRLLPQGLEPLMPLVLGSQDAHVQNNGINTGTWANFGTYLLHTDTDSVTIQNITKGDRAKIQQVAAIQKRHTGWIFLRGRDVFPIWLPWVTNELVAAWVSDLDSDVELPQPAAVAGADEPDDVDLDAGDASLVAAAGQGDPRPEDWPESVRALITALGDRLPILVQTFAALDWKVPVRVGGAERRAILGIPQPNDPPNIAPYDARLVRLLAQLRRADVRSNTLAAFLFGRTGQAAQDITTAIERNAR